MLGAEPVQLAPSRRWVPRDRDGAALAMCGRPFIFYNHQADAVYGTPLARCAYECGSASPMCPLAALSPFRGQASHCGTAAAARGPTLASMLSLSAHASPPLCTRWATCLGSSLRQTAARRSAMRRMRPLTREHLPPLRPQRWRG